jgi:hypothetical protein
MSRKLTNTVVHERKEVKKNRREKQFTLCMGNEN